MKIEYITYELDSRNRVNRFLVEMKALGLYCKHTGYNITADEFYVSNSSYFFIPADFVLKIENNRFIVSSKFKDSKLLERIALLYSDIYKYQTIKVILR